VFEASFKPVKASNETFKALAIKAAASIFGLVLLLSLIERRMNK